LVVYSMISKPSFGEARTLQEQIRRAKDSDHVPTILVANKSDLEDQRQVSVETGQELARKYNSPYYETSAKTGENVETVFLELVREVRRMKRWVNKPDKGKGGKGKGKGKGKSKGGGGCVIC